MSHDANDLANMVILTVKAALAPVYERLSAIEAFQKSASGVEKRVGELSDRLLTFETKEAVEVPDAIGPAVVTAMAPVMERLAAAEARLAAVPVAEKSLTELRDRVVVMETKADTPVERPTIDLSPVLERIAALESRIDRLPEAEKSISEVRDRLLVFETKASGVPPSVELQTPEPVDLAPILARVDELKDALSIKSTAPSVDLSPLTERLSKLETKSIETAPTIATVGELAKDVVSLRERLSAVEARQPVPGPQGPKGEDGKDGKDGRDGKDGADGLGYDELAVVQTAERGITVKAFRGDRSKDIGTVVIPAEIYRGVWEPDRTYERGDCVTFGGSEFHCNETTMSKPEQSKAWTLKVKRGRDGRDGKDAVTLPVVKVGGNG